jgi:membrane protease YdiL (CAAX protease family)
MMQFRSVGIGVAAAWMALLVSTEAARWAVVPVDQQLALSRAMLVLFATGMYFAGAGDYGLRAPGRLPWIWMVPVSVVLGVSVGWAGAVPGPWWLWVFIGFADEVFVRGWLQAALAPVKQKLGEWSLPVLASGLFAGSMYLTLMKQRAPGPTVLALVVGSTALGLAAAKLREETGSLAGPVAMHILFGLGLALA